MGVVREHGCASAVGMVFVCLFCLCFCCFFFFLMIRRPPRSTQGGSSAASDRYRGRRRMQRTRQDVCSGSPLHLRRLVGLCLFCPCIPSVVSVIALRWRKPDLQLYGKPLGHQRCPTISAIHSGTFWSRTQDHQADFSAWLTPELEPSFPAT